MVTYVSQEIRRAVAIAATAAGLFNQPKVGDNQTGSTAWFTNVPTRKKIQSKRKKALETPDDKKSQKGQNVSS